ncbi:MAG: hypothetical protein AAFU57_17865 [Bacteroidota bacterium]
MKQLGFLIFALTIMLSCNQQKDQKERSDKQSEPEKELNSQVIDEILKLENRRDTIHNYWELILDTISEHEEFEVDSKNYKLEVRTYSLNDSAIIRNLSDFNSQLYLDYSHTMVTDFYLRTDSITEHRQIDRADFESVLFPEFYAECNLYSSEIDSIVGDVIYLTSDLAVPDTDNQWRVWYSLKINDERLAVLEIREVDYVGL